MECLCLFTIEPLRGVVIYAGFEMILISGVLRCDAGITVNREHLYVSPF